MGFCIYTHTRAHAEGEKEVIPTIVVELRENWCPKSVSFFCFLSSSRRAVVGSREVGSYRCDFLVIISNAR